MYWTWIIRKWVSGSTIFRTITDILLLLLLFFFLKKQIKLLHYRGEKKEIHPIQTLGREIQLIRWTD